MKSVSFTGHRNLPTDITNFSMTLRKVIERAIVNNGVTDFYAGGAYGFDMLAESIVLKLREIYPHIKLHLILPCSNQEQTHNWMSDEKIEFERIQNLADSIEFSSEHICKDYMKKRNKRLIDYADICICYLNEKNKRSGTSQTVRFAREKNIPIINIYE